MEKQNPTSDSRQAQARHALTRLNLASLTVRASELNVGTATPQRLWEQVEQLLLAVYWRAGLSGALTGLAALAAAALLEHDRSPATSEVGLPGWEDCRNEHGPWPEQFPAPDGPVAAEDWQTWVRLVEALEGKHACDVIPLGTAPNRLARLAAGAIVRVVLAADSDDGSDRDAAVAGTRGCHPSVAQSRPDFG